MSWRACRHCRLPFDSSSSLRKYCDDCQRCIRPYQNIGGRDSACRYCGRDIKTVRGCSGRGHEPVDAVSLVDALREVQRAMA